MTDRDLKNLWNEQPSDPTVTLEDVKQRAAKFERDILWRNILEWGAALLVAILFGAQAIEATTTLGRVGNGTVVLASLFIALHLWRRGRVKPVENETSDTRTFVAAHAEVLRDQARLLASVPFWYLGPLVVGMTILMADRYPTESQPAWPWLMTVAIVTVVFAGVWVINIRGARHLNARADALLVDLG